ncbi:hypothetical protein DICPUDRAFT_84764 [Dictyostelium purpureum]|uniref:Uncharacterized protein n=1 Tax=Dictyostelium purpureum TaxID=5786 RepID=F1A3N6_DICPU|nr:uncharacterized protein DICPUDRAFT_84764 [Dictyostelium purpureum]EGC29197.1 hypothetical protein DICPUDRAFT_84764 [Dictyostelium purpureum]|eukprot:XP_003294280.1 hypothetical protein DICPUDRAFT_84764 [Dictyostelium purpureum]
MDGYDVSNYVYTMLQRYQISEEQSKDQIHFFQSKDPSYDHTHHQPGRKLLNQSEHTESFRVFFDLTHICKNLRNNLIAHTPIQISSNSKEFLDMKLILKLFQERDISILIPNDFHPSDKMALDPVKRLFSEKTTDTLSSIICDFETSIRDNSIDPNQSNQLKEQIVKIKNIITYLINLRIIYRISTASVLVDMKQSLEQFGSGFR